MASPRVRRLRRAAKIAAAAPAKIVNAPVAEQVAPVVEEREEAPVKAAPAISKPTKKAKKISAKKDN